MIERSPYLTSLQVNRDIIEKKPIIMRGIEESKIKTPKKEEVAPKKEEPSRRGAGKVSFRGEFHPSADSRASSARIGQRIGGSSPLQRLRGHTSPIPVRDRTPPMQPMRGRPSPSRYDRQAISQPRERTQAPVMRDRMPPTMAKGRLSPNQLRGRTPPVFFRSHSPPPVQLSHHSAPSHIRDHQNQMRSRTSPHMLRGRSPTLYHGRGRSPPPDMMGRMAPTISRGRSPPPPPQMRGRSPPHMRGPSPSDRMRSRSPVYRSGRSPRPHSRNRTPIRVRSPGRLIRGRTPLPYDRALSPGHGHMHNPRPPTPTKSMGGHISRRDQMISNRGRSPPPRGRSPLVPTRRERTPPPIQISRRLPSPDFRRNEQPTDRHYGMRYEDNRRAIEELPREYNEKLQSSNSYGSDNRGYGVSNDYYPERYEKPRRDRSLSQRHHLYYTNQKEELNSRSEYSPPRETKRRRKASPTSDVRDVEKTRRSSPPSGYMNSRDGFKKEKREHPANQWGHIKDKEGPDCREILNEKRSMRDTYPESQHTAYQDASKFPPSNTDLREALEEEKRRRHGHNEPNSYYNKDVMDDRNMMHPMMHDPTQGYLHRAEADIERSRSRHDYYDTPINHSEIHHLGSSYQEPNLYAGPINAMIRDNFIKSREGEFRKTRGRRGKRPFDRMRRGRGRRGGGHWS